MSILLLRSLGVEVMDGTEVDWLLYVMNGFSKIVRIVSTSNYSEYPKPCEQELDLFHRKEYLATARTWCGL